MITINGKEYPFESPTHKQVGHEEVLLTPEQVDEILQQWAIEYDKITEHGSSSD